MNKFKIPCAEDSNLRYKKSKKCNSIAGEKELFYYENVYIIYLFQKCAM